MTRKNDTWKLHFNRLLNECWDKLSLGMKSIFALCDHRDYDTSYEEEKRRYLKPPFYYRGHEDDHYKYR